MFRGAPDALCSVPDAQREALQQRRAPSVRWAQSRFGVAAAGGMQHVVQVSEQLRAAMAAQVQKRKLVGRLDPAHEEFAQRPADDRVRSFWKFMIEAVRGPESEFQYCREFELGGVLPFMADVRTATEEVLLCHHGNLGEQLWRVMVVVWLGGGGPGFRTFRHVTSDAPLCGQLCPREARLPLLHSSTDVSAMFNHLKNLAERHGRDEVLSGDGRHVQFRFCRQQGVAMLQQWRECAKTLERRAGGTGEGFDALWTRDVYQHICSTSGIGELAAKEIFCFLYAAFPQSINVDRFVPVGAGAKRGGRLVLDIDPNIKDVEWFAEFQRMTREMPPDLRARLKEAIHRRASTHPYRDDNRIPGVRNQLKIGAPTVADVEVCMCFFMNFLKAVWGGTPPRGWRMLLRKEWEHCRGRTR